MFGGKIFQISLIFVMITVLFGGTLLAAQHNELHFPIDVTGFSSQDLSEIQIIVNGQTVQTDVDPVIRDAHLLIPLRAVFNALGAEVHWFEDPRTVAMVDQEKEIRIIIQLNNNVAYGNRKHWNFEMHPILHGDRTMVMPEVIALGYEVEVEWNKDTKQLRINTN